MRNTRVVLILLVGLLAMASSVALAHEPVKLTGYVVDVACATDHVNDKAEDAMKFAGEHSKSCGLMEDCVKSGYGIFSDGKWYPFDARGNEIAKGLFDRTSKKDHIKVSVEGMKHQGKILVEKITETE